jgi:transposase InsO family protein
MSPTGARQDLQTIQQSVAAGSVVVASTGTGPFEQRHSADLFGARQRWRLGQAFTSRIRTVGIRDRPISPRSPWQNAHVERLIGTLWRECLDHVLIYGERHLRQILTLYSLYYNEMR